MAAIAMRLALMRPSMDQQDMKEDARSDIQQALAVTRILAVWRGKKTRERRVERRLPVVALLASIEVSKHRRRGFVQFILYLAYNWLLGALVLQISDQQHAYEMDHKMSAVFEPGRASVQDVDSAWQYISDIHVSLFNTGQRERNKAAFLASACPFTSAAASNPCQNAVCEHFLSTGSLTGPDAAACQAVIGTHCASYGAAEATCAKFPSPSAGGSCAFTVAAPTNPCSNPVCSVLAAVTSVRDATSPDNTTDSANSSLADTATPAGAAVACTATVAAHCALFPDEAGCVSTESARRQLEEGGALQRLEPPRTPNDDLVGMVDTSNRVIGAMLVWHSRYVIAPCTEFPELVGQCVVPGSVSYKGFTGKFSGSEYAPGIYNLGNDVPPFNLSSTSTAAKARVGETQIKDLFLLPLDVGNFPEFGFERSKLYMNLLRADGWLDFGVHKVIVVLNTFNANVNRFCSTVVEFKFLPGGTVTSTRIVASAPTATTANATLSIVAIICIFVDTLLIAGRVVERFVRVHKSTHRDLMERLKALRQKWRGALRLTRSDTTDKSGLRLSRSSTSSSISSDIWKSHESARRLQQAEQAAKSPWWLLIEVAAGVLVWIYLFSLTALGTATAEVTKAMLRLKEDEPILTPELLGLTLDINYLVVGLSERSRVMSYSACLVFFFLLQRMFKYCLFHRRMSTISAIISNAANEMSYFIILFTLITLSFALTATILFGKLQSKFTGLGNSFETLCLLLVEQFSYDDYTDLDIPAFGKLFFWLYICISYLLLLNALLAIIIDAYVLAKSDASEEPSMRSIAKDTLLHFVLDVADLFSLLMRCCSKRKDGDPNSTTSTRRRSGVLPLFWGRFNAARRRSLARTASDVVLNAEKAKALIHMLADSGGIVDDVLISRRLARKKNSLLAKGQHLTLAQLVELLGAVTATRVMRKYGVEVARGGPQAADFDGPSFEEKIARSLMQIGRGVDRVNEHAQLLSSAQPSPVHSRIQHDRSSEADSGSAWFVPSAKPSVMLPSRASRPVGG
mmetsp:Transcript_4458/g.10754  ORF Transcript_4458/g.10754 Transcript_4458/m.10754 type:complete len:1026 (+) Transcript_4458:63-3140(+)